MNKITLNELCYAGEYKNLLSLKSNLINYKRKGHLFFRERVFNLNPFEKFELYYYMTKGNIDYRNAFPIPKSSYDCFRLRKDSLDSLKDFYCSYYRVEDISDDYFMGLHRFVGEDYVWFYNKT